MLSHIDQYLGAGTFPDFPHFPAPCDGVRGRPRHLVGNIRPASSGLISSQLPSSGYTAAEPAQCITRQKRHRSTFAKTTV
jgi:hypothetical protein